MTNQTIVYRKGEKRPMDGNAAQHRWLGYDDFIAGRGFRPEYDTFSPAMQRNYESGRQYAASVRGAGAALPKWPRNRKLSAVMRAAVGPALAAATAVEINGLFRPRPTVEA